MLEPITAGAIAIGTVLATKALEKTGEKIGETAWDKTCEFLNVLKQKSPGAIVAIEKAQEQRLDYGQAILEVKLAAEANPEVDKAVQELVTEAQTNPSSEWKKELKQTLEDIAKELKLESQHNQNWNLTVEKIVNFAKRDINITTQNINL